MEEKFIIDVENGAKRVSRDVVNTRVEAGILFEEKKQALRDGKVEGSMVVMHTAEYYEYKNKEGRVYESGYRPKQYIDMWHVK